MGNRFLVLAALSGFFSVAFGAYSAHALVGDMTVLEQDWLIKAQQYQFIHTLALLALGFFVAATKNQVQPSCRRMGLNWIGYSWAVGILCFSGSLYVMAITGTQAVKYLTPIGGVAFLVGWGALSVISIGNCIKPRD
ncbi:DUF423 domain-containing protein [Spirabiliibacterium falconis]|uniref:DUF423 domain-containing protein n=1 Tax=Spirabiliibacterium falconis TaxID=572023 RepID=UPI001AAD2020|nr:DUF423 domain-containing protein [Spirabiliibacterium falconis]MBE2894118.1 DUF423 domain-containing protein [Spirabiliibacterium falconis]